LAPYFSKTNEVKELGLPESIPRPKNINGINDGISPATIKTPKLPIGFACEI
jgi:hypothetical protein